MPPLLSLVQVYHDNVMNFGACGSKITSSFSSFLVIYVLQLPRTIRLTRLAEYGIQIY